MSPSWFLSVLLSLHCVENYASGAEEALGQDKEALPLFAYLFGKALFELIQPCDEYQNSEDRCNAQGMKFNQ